MALFAISIGLQSGRSLSSLAPLNAIVLFAWLAAALSLFMMVIEPDVASTSEGYQVGRLQGIYTHRNHLATVVAPNSFNDLSDEALDADLRALKRWLLDNRLRGADHLAYPKGQTDSRVQGIVDRYFTSG